MGKLKTTLVNESGKNLQLFEQTSNGEYRRRTNLPNPGTDQPNSDLMVETREKIPQTSNIVGEDEYFIESDPNQTYWTLSVWYGKVPVLNVTSDELIDSAVITLGWDEGKNEFTKNCTSRSETTGRNKPAAATTPAPAMTGAPREVASNPQSNTKGFLSGLRSMFKLNKQ